MVFLLPETWSPSWLNGEVIPLLLFTIVTTETNVISFWQIPTFSRGVICQFSNNASEMRRLAACNFKDLLQASIYMFLG